jgi:hypothetical protein
MEKQDETSRAQLVCGFSQRRSSFIHSTEATFQEPTASLSMGDESLQNDLEDEGLLASVFADNETERSRMSHERDHHRPAWDDGTTVEGHSQHVEDLAAHDLSNMHSSHRRENYSKSKHGNRGRSSLSIRPKRLDLASMLDRCGGDLELLNSVLDRFYKHLCCE